MDLRIKTGYASSFRDLEIKKEFKAENKEILLNKLIKEMIVIITYGMKDGLDCLWYS